MKTRIPQILASALWLVATGCGAAVVYGIYHYISTTGFMDTNISAFYNAMARPTFAMCVSWVIVACITGNAGNVWMMRSLSSIALLYGFRFSGPQDKASYGSTRQEVVDGLQRISVRLCGSTKRTFCQSALYGLNTFWYFSENEHISKSTFFSLQTGPIPRLLNWTLWTPISKLTYTVYLVHVLVIYWYMGVQESPMHFSYVHYVYFYFGEFQYYTKMKK